MSTQTKDVIDASEYEKTFRALNGITETVTETLIDPIVELVQGVTQPMDDPSVKLYFLGIVTGVIITYIASRF